MVFLAHQEENLGRWLAPQLLIALRETSLLCLVDGVRSTSPGLREATAALRSSKNLSLSRPSHPFLPGIKSSSLFPSSLNLSRGSSHSPCSLPRSPEWGGGRGRGEGSGLRESSAKIPRDSPAAAAATASYVFPFDKSPLLQQK